MSISKYFLTALAATFATTVSAQNTPVSQMEKLDRGIAVVKPTSGSGNFVSWRLLGTDGENTTFDLRKGATTIARNLTVTNYRDNTGTNQSDYSVVTKVNGEPVDTSKAVKAWGKPYLLIQLDRPATGKQGGNYIPNDCSVGDVDGDGEYEIFLKWDPDNSKDNSQNGITDNVLIDCYKLDGTKLWRIDLGQNIRAGAHYTQFMVYDFDGDGRAEMMCKTAPGSKDGLGIYVNQATTNTIIKGASNTKSWITSSGRMDGGHEYLTVFEGLTGKAIHTIAYNPNRNAQSGLSEAQGTFNWAIGKTDNHGYNRGDRYLAAVAYLDGPDKNPSGIFCRGYYSYAFVWAVDFDGQQLKPKWFHASDNSNGSTYKLTTYNDTGAGSTKTYTNCKPTSGSGHGTMFGNGNHNMSIADVDGDGCDEIIWGSAALNNNGILLYGTGFGHGDAIHLADHCPDRPGLEVFQVHEEKGTYAWDLHDAHTGAIIHKGGPAGVDNGRGMAGAFDLRTRGSLFWSASDSKPRSAVTGITAYDNGGSSNFRIYWDGDLQDELLDGNKLDKFNNGSGGTSRLFTIYNFGPASTCNSTKNTPNLQADILGDWREEVILHNGSDQLAIYSTDIATTLAVPTLMHDHTYRMGIAWQNTAYNQPPHLGYYLPDLFRPCFLDRPDTIHAALGDTLVCEIKTKNVKICSFMASILPDGTRKGYVVPDGFNRPKYDQTHKMLTISGKPKEAGIFKFAFKITGVNADILEDTLIVKVSDAPSIITETVSTVSAAKPVIYDASGRKLPHQQMSTLPKGLYIILEGNKSRKILIK